MDHFEGCCSFPTILKGSGLLECICPLIFHPVCQSLLVNKCSDFLAMANLWGVRCNTVKCKSILVTKLLGKTGVGLQRDLRASLARAPVFFQLFPCGLCTEQWCKATLDIEPSEFFFYCFSYSAQIF